MTTSPAISVIIPTRNRCPILQRTLAALEAQDCPPDTFEVLVIADGCSDDTVAMVRRLRPRFALRLIEQPALGLTLARNAGASKARASLLLYMDDDVEAIPGLMTAHVRAHHGHAQRVVLAPYILEWRGQPSFHQIQRQIWWSDRFFELGRPGHRFTFTDLSGGNFSLPTALYQRVGGFDPVFVGYGGKDYELGARLLKAGAEFVFAADAVGYHNDEPERGIQRTLRRIQQEARNDVRLGRLHPELRPALPVVGITYAYKGPNSLLRKLAFDTPESGDRLTERFYPLLGLYEYLGRQPEWRYLSGKLRFYWYCRGVAEELGTQAELAEYMQEGTHAAAQMGVTIDLDLQSGLAACKERLDRERPDGVYLHYGTLPLTHIPPEPGAEPLRGVHLRPLLAKQQNTGPLAVALAMHTVVQSS